MKDMTNLDQFEVGYDIPAKPGMDEADIQTPSLILDLDALERNIKKMGDYAKAHGMRHRVHGKMHKSVDVAKLQEKIGGAVGVAFFLPDRDNLFQTVNAIPRCFVATVISVRGRAGDQHGAFAYFEFAQPLHQRNADDARPFLADLGGNLFHLLQCHRRIGFIFQFFSADDLVIFTRRGTCIHLPASSFVPATRSSVRQGSA